MKSLSEKQHTWLLRKFHTLCTRLELPQYAKSAMVESYGETSSRDLSNEQLNELVKKLELQLKPDLGEMDMWRKRVMAAVGGWLRTIGHEQCAQKIKGIACRATGHDGYNDIPKQQLINLYYTFLKKQKDFKAVSEIAAEELEILSYMN